MRLYVIDHPSLHCVNISVKAILDHAINVHVESKRVVFSFICVHVFKFAFELLLVCFFEVLLSPFVKVVESLRYFLFFVIFYILFDLFSKFLLRGSWLVFYWLLGYFIEFIFSDYIFQEVIIVLF